MTVNFLDAVGSVEFAFIDVMLGNEEEISRGSWGVITNFNDGRIGLYSVASFSSLLTECIQMADA